MCNRRRRVSSRGLKYNFWLSDRDKVVGSRWLESVQWSGLLWRCLDSPAPNRDNNRAANLGDPGAFFSFSLISLTSGIPARTKSPCFVLDRVFARSGVLGALLDSEGFKVFANNRRGTGRLDGESTTSGRCNSAALRAGEGSGFSCRRVSVLSGDPTVAVTLTLFREGVRADPESDSAERGEGERDTEADTRGMVSDLWSEEPIGRRLRSRSSISVAVEPTLLVDEERAREEVGTSSVAGERIKAGALPTGRRVAPRLTPRALVVASICFVTGLISIVSVFALADAILMSSSAMTVIASIPTGLCPLRGCPIASPPFAIGIISSELVRCR